MDEHFLFYVPPELIKHDRILFSEDEAHHIAKVLRKQPGDVVQVTDGVGNTMDVRLIVVDKKKVAGEVTATYNTPAEPDRILAMGVIRQRERLEFAIEKAVELGVTKIVLVHSEHAGRMEVKPKRVEKTIISAMKQSRRPWLPAWEERDSFYDVLAEYRESREVVMAHPEVEGTYDWKGDDSPMLLLVGPEGGFSQKEVELAVASGVKMVSLGQKRLRTETAVCAILTLANLSR
jgi:16S rRNA (uracil1498-N3)-methyltransferase